jgi:hypothetical protein
LIGEKLVRWILAMAVALTVSTNQAQAQRVDRIVIFEKGQYIARSSVVSPRSGTMGQLRAVRDAHLLAATTSIPARRHNRFGLRYVVQGERRGATVELRMVTRFPDGGIVDSATGQRHFTDEYRMPVQIGARNYRDYHLDENWEAVLGQWIFEFWLNDRKLKEQEFCLFDPAKPQVDACRQLISQMIRP